MKKISKSMAKKIALMVLLSSAVGMHSVWAYHGPGENEIMILKRDENPAHTKTERGNQVVTAPTVTTGDNDTGIGVTGGVMGSSVEKILTGDELEVDIFGIKVTDSNSVSADSISNGIDVKSVGISRNATAIYLNSTNTSTLSNLGNIKAEATGTGLSYSYGISALGGTNTVTFSGTDKSITAKGTSYVYGVLLYGGNGAQHTISGLSNITAETTGGASATGISVTNKNEVTGPKISVDFATIGGSISAYSVSGKNYGILFDDSGVPLEVTGTSEIKNVKTIEAGFKDDNISSGNAYGIYAEAGVNTVTFTGTDSSITVKSECCAEDTDAAYGIFVTGAGTTEIKNLASIEIYGLRAFGIYTKDATGTTAIDGLSKINVEADAGSDGFEATGIYSQGSDANYKLTATFTGTGEIEVKSELNNARGISVIGTGTTTISGLSSITSTAGDAGDAGDAYGIYANNGNEVGSTTFSVSMDEGSISACSVGNNGFSYGIFFHSDSTGVSEVLGVNKITAGSDTSPGPVRGIYAAAGVNTVAFAGSDNSITVKNTDNTAYGIYVNGGTTTVSGVQKISATSNVTAKSIYVDEGATLILQPKIKTGDTYTTTDAAVAVFGTLQVDLPEDCVAGNNIVTIEGASEDSVLDGTIQVDDRLATGLLEDESIVLISNNSAFDVRDDIVYKYYSAEEGGFVTGDDAFSLEDGNKKLVYTKVSAGLPSAIQGGSKKVYEFKKDEILKKDLGTLNNSKRQDTGLTIEGKGKTLFAKDDKGVTHKGVTISNDTDKLFVNDLTIDGFDTFATVEAGELTLKNVTFTNSGTVNVVNNSAHTVIIDGTVTLDKGITGDGRIVQKDNSTLVVDVTNPPANAYIQAGELEIGDNTTLSVTGAKGWDTLKLVEADSIKDGKLWSKVAGNVPDFFGEIDVKNGVVTIEYRNIPLAVEGNTSALAGVQQGAITMVNQIADAVGENVGIIARPAQEGVYDKTIWANYINSKETVNGMSMWRGTGDNTAKYHGVTVGADFYTTKKAIAGVALTYVTGDVNSNATATVINNKTKYYGISFYDRVTNGKGAWTYDLGYSQGKNEITQNSYGVVTADAKTNAYTLGAKYEYAYNFKHSALVPFASLRYLRLSSNDYSNSNGHSMNINKQNLIVPKLGLAWTGNFEMPKSGWNFKPVAEVGYIWNLKGREADGTFTTRNGVYNVAYDTVDKSSYYTKLGMNFNKKNFTGGVSYRYAKGDAARQNSWNVNLSWNF